MVGDGGSFERYDAEQTLSLLGTSEIGEDRLGVWFSGRNTAVGVRVDPGAVGFGFERQGPSTLVAPLEPPAHYGVGERPTIGP